MENPATWNEAEKAIAEALDEFYKARHEGLSNVRRIYLKLREKGLIEEPPKSGGPWIRTVDHITYVVRPDTIRKWAWYYTEVLGGKFTNRIDDADPLGKSSMMLWEIDFGSFAIALVAGIDREEKSHVTVFAEKHGDRTVQHIAFRAAWENLDGLKDHLEHFSARFQNQLLARQEGRGFVKQIFLWPVDDLVNPAESSFDELQRRPRSNSPITFDEDVAAKLYQFAQELMCRDERAPMIDWLLMPKDWEPPAIES